MFKIGDFAFDRMTEVIAENTVTDQISYILKNTSDGSVEVTPEYKEVKDRDGKLIRKTLQAKSGTVSITNAMQNVYALSASTGTDVIRAEDTTGGLQMPKVITVAATKKTESGTTVPNTVVLDGFVEGTCRVKASYTNGASYGKYVIGTDFTIAKTTVDEKDVYTLTLPNVSSMGEDAPTQFVVKYTRTVETGIEVTNVADKEAKIVKLLIKALYVDACGDLKGAYIEVPRFQPSSDTTISMATDATFDYKGDILTSICADEKIMYTIYFPDDDEDDEE